MFRRNFKLCDFPVHSVCFLYSFFVRSEQKFSFVLYHWPNFENFHRQLSEIFFKNFEGTRSLFAHARARATYSILSWIRALERMGGETSQLALARCVMRGVLGRERSRGRTVEKWRVKTKFCSTYKVHCYG